MTDRTKEALTWFAGVIKFHLLQLSNDVEAKAEIQGAYENLMMALAAEERKPVGLRIVFDGPPGPVSGRFVEVEREDGSSVNAGKWVERPDGLWELQLTALLKGD